MAAETRFQRTAQQDPDRYQELVASAERRIHRRLALYRDMASPKATAEETDHDSAQTHSRRH